MFDPDQRNRGTSPFFRIVNPEFHVKPNVRVGIAGTALFVAIFSRLLWEKYRYEKEQKQLQHASVPLERKINEDS